MLFGSEGRTATNLIESKTIKENGTYSAIYEIDPETGEVYDPPKDGYQTVVISLPIYNKRVALTTSDVTDSQTAIFEYDPQDETPNPWEGYLYFTIDLSGVKRDINDLLDQISALEDQLEEMQECCEDVAEILDATPEEGESCCDAVKSKAQEAVDHIEECDQCKDAVVAAIQQYVPSFTPDPTTCNIPDGVDDVYEQGKEDEATENPPGYKFPPDDPDNPDPDRYDKIAELIGNDTLTDEDVHIYVKAMDVPDPNGHNVYYAFYNSTNNTYLDRTQAFSGSDDGDYVTGFRITNTATGDYEFYWVIPGNPPYYYTGTSSYLIGYGDPTHSYTVTNKKNS